MSGIVVSVDAAPAGAGRPRPGGPAPSPQPHGRDPEAVRDYEETLTTVMIASGLPRMMSRVLVCLYTTDAGSLTASELAQRLQVGHQRPARRCSRSK